MNGVYDGIARVLRTTDFVSAFVAAVVADQRGESPLCVSRGVCLCWRRPVSTADDADAACSLCQIHAKQRLACPERKVPGLYAISSASQLVKGDMVRRFAGSYEGPPHTASTESSRSPSPQGRTVADDAAAEAPQTGASAARLLADSADMMQLIPHLQCRC